MTPILATKKSLDLYVNKFHSMREVLSRCFFVIPITLNVKFEFDKFFEFEFILDSERTLKLFNIINGFIKVLGCFKLK